MKYYYHKQQFRLPGFNYASNNAYFITIMAAGRNHYFGEISDGEMHYSEIGEIALHQLNMAIEHKKNILIPDYVIMPNHVHIVVGLQNEVVEQKPVPIAKSPFIPGEIHALQKGSLAAFVNSFKGRVTRAAREKGYSDFGWQAKYNDRIIRDRPEYLRISKYIAENVSKWDSDSENTLQS